jgi:mono/diheme cytochrome c family protein
MKARLGTALAATSLLLSFSGCTFGWPRATERRDGAAMFSDYCAACHGGDGRGDGPVASALRREPTDLTSLARGAGGVFPRERVIAVITGEREIDAHGSREMPVWSQRFAPSDTAATAIAFIARRRALEILVDHLESIQR